MGLNSTETWKQKLCFEPQRSQGFGCYGRSFAQALYMWTMFLGKSTHHLQYRDVINKFNKISVACNDLTFKSTSKFSPSMLFYIQVDQKGTSQCVGLHQLVSAFSSFYQNFSMLLAKHSLI